MSKFIDSKYFQILEYKWEPTYVIKRNPSTILSEKIHFQGQKLFQVGLRHDVHSFNLMFLTFGLSKLGLDKNAHIIVTGHDIFREEMFLEKEDHKSPSIQLYASGRFNDMMTGDLSFTFHVYITTCTQVPNYYPVRMDDLLGNQLWEAAVNRQGTDFELIAEGRRFPVHKFILAARSPGFATWFGKEKSTRMHFPYESASTLERLLKFIYTGELMGGIIHPMFQMETLYCLFAGSGRIQEDSLLQDDPTRLAKILKINGNNALKINPAGESDINFKSNSFIFSSTWMIPLESQEMLSTSEPSLVSGGFGIDSSNDMFSAEITYDFSREQFDLSFLVQHHATGRNCCSVQEVFCCLNNGIKLHLETMNPSSGERHIQLFTGAQPVPWCEYLGFPSKITFFVKMISTIPTFSYKPRDLLYANNIWFAAARAADVTERTTDIEIIVGLDDPFTFHAHRFILCSRSPVFDTMLNSAFEEARTGVIRITDVDPDIFAHFFKFLYTGQLPIDGDDEDLRANLFELADRYDVVTLANFCRPSSEDPVDED